MTGTVVVSLDAELAWGSHDVGVSSTASETDGSKTGVRRTYDAVTSGYYTGNRLTTAELATARRSWQRLLDAFDEFGVPATWAVVGHLFLEDCDGEHATHPLSPAWFASDPGGNAAEHPLWFAPDLLADLESRPTDHEVGSHSFSHVEFGDATRATADAELAAATAASETTLTSLVFPRNRIGHLDVLADHGFTCYRGLMPRWYDDTVLRPAAKATNMVAQFSAPRVSHPTVDEHGLVDIPASLDLFGFEGWARSLAAPFVTDPLVRQVKAGIERAVSEDGVFHLWFHPNDVQTPAHLDRVRTVLAHIAERRAANDITVETMSEVAERTRNPEAANE